MMKQNTFLVYFNKILHYLNFIAGNLELEKLIIFGPTFDKNKSWI
jgi:hypothetical protein